MEALRAGYPKNWKKENTGRNNNHIKPGKMAKKDFSFNEAIVRIEEILHNIESGELDVDRLSEQVKTASELIKQCQKKLKTTEEEINSIFSDLS